MKETIILCIILKMLVKIISNAPMYWFGRETSSAPDETDKWNWQQQLDL